MNSDVCATDLILKNCIVAIINVIPNKKNSFLIQLKKKYHATEVLLQAEHYFQVPTTAYITY